MASVVYTTDPASEDLEAALRRILATTSCPLYLRVAAEAWLARR